MRVLKLGQSLVSTKTPAVFKNLYSLNFDGVDDYVNYGDSNTFSFGNGTSDTPFSMSIWFKMADISNMPIINKTTAVSAQREYYMYINQNDKLVMALFDTSTGGYIFASSTAAITSVQGSWSHVVFTYDGGGAATDMTIYLNGSSIALSTSSGTIGSGSYVAMENTAFPLHVGFFELISRYTNGNFDEFSMWNKELTSGNVTALYNSGEPTNLSGEAGLIGWWRMGDPNGAAAYPTIVDQSTNSNDGTMTNMASGDIVTDVPS
tara:strand:+ start:295 stop:1083 length:789 start_codon:yes stop_codon:yes gene_type:complete